MSHWAAFVDESGNFGDPDQAVCIACLLLQDTDHRTNQRALREVLEAVDPIVPYPLHTAHLNKPTFYAACWQLADESTRRDHPAAEALERAVACLQVNARVHEAAKTRAVAQRCAHLAVCGRCLTGDLSRRAGPAPLKRFLTLLDLGKTPKVGLLNEVDAWLSFNAPAVWQELSGVKEQVWWRMGQLLHYLGASYGPDRCFVVAAADVPGLTSPLARGEDRYLRLMTVLLERVVATLRASQTSGAEVLVRPETRHVVVSGVPGTTPLMSWHLQPGIEEAQRLPFRPAADPAREVSLTAAVPAVKNDLMHPGIVIADVIATRLLPSLRGNIGWRQLRRRSLSRVYLPLEVRPGAVREGSAVPGAAAAGTPREAINQVFAAQGTGRLSDQVQASLARVVGLTPGWTEEQAGLWINLALELA